MGKDVHGQIRETTRRDSSEHTGFACRCDVAALLAALILLIIVAACVASTPKGVSLAYNGRYVDLLSYERESTLLGTGEVQVTKVDTETGLPAGASLTQIAANGKVISKVNTVTFNFQGRSVALSFTDDVTDRFCYLDELTLDSKAWGNKPDILEAMLTDYSAQVGELVP